MDEVDEQINSVSEETTENYRWNGEHCDASPIIPVLKVAVLSPGSSGISSFS